VRYRIIITNPARKQLLKLPETIQNRVEQAIDALGDTPRRQRIFYPLPNRYRRR